MKRLILLALSLSLVACRSETPLGRCIGLNQEPDTALRYEASARNIAVAVIFSEMVVPPIVVALNKYKCPVARRHTLTPVG
jgi:hypothetical protein